MVWSTLVFATWARMASRPMTGHSVPEAFASRYADVALETGSLVPGLHAMGKSCSSNDASGAKVDAKSSQLWWSALYAYLLLTRLIFSMARSCSTALRVSWVDIVGFLSIAAPAERNGLGGAASWL